MATVVTCNSGELSFSCCGAGTGTEDFNGIKIASIGITTFVYNPYSLKEKTTTVLVWDLVGNWAEIDATDAGFADAAALNSFLSNCRNYVGSAAKYQKFTGVTGTDQILTVTVDNLPTSEIENRILVFRGNVKAVYTDNYTVSGNQITMLNESYGENVEVYFWPI